MAYRGGFGFGFGLTPWVQRLLIINGVVFVMQMLTSDALTAYLAFVPGLVLVRPWTIVTYMFAHGDFFHLFFNMLVLFFFGPPLEARWGSREFIKYYFIAGIGAAALSFLLSYNAAIIGASGAVYGVMLAFAMLWPDSEIYIWGILPVKAKWLVAFLAVVSILSIRGGAGNIAHAAHLGGFVAGFLYLKFSGPGGMFGGFRRMMNRRRLRVVPDDRPTPPVRTGPPPSARRRASGPEEEKLLDELDRVLEKISTQGMSSLTAQERRLLDEVSRKYRTD